ncbi:MAG: MerC domain-containing protein [Armatimonadetes bacterium]|nr:MerC domain-containing protein [Armatimonadota bacterium]
MQRQKWTLDHWAAFAGAACAVHCVVLGLLLGLLPAIGTTLFADHGVDLFFIGIAVVFGPWAIIRGYQVHHEWTPSLLVAIGLLMVIFANFAMEHRHEHLISLPALISAAGGILLATGHIVNHRMHARHGCHNDFCRHH